MLPVGHSLMGLLIYGIFNQKKEWRHDIGIILIYVFLVNLPDGDFIPVVFGFDSYNVFHRGITHTLLFSLIVAVIFSAGLRLKNNTPFMASFPIFFLLLYSHVVIDIFGIDTSPPKGVMAFYPLTDQYFTYPLLPQVPHGNLQELLSIVNLKTAIYESSLFLPFLFVLILRKRKV